jgi:hypothetical protein
VYLFSSMQVYLLTGYYLVGAPISRSAGSLVSRLAGSLVSRLAGSLVGRLAGAPVSSLLHLMASKFRLD